MPTPRVRQRANFVALSRSAATRQIHGLLELKDLIDLMEGRSSTPKKTPLGEPEQVQALPDRSNHGGR